MSAEFQFAGGSWIGRDHRWAGLNSQDSWTILTTGDLTVGVVADGCGSHAHSEVGAQLGVKILAESIRAAYSGPKHQIKWSRVQQQVVSQLDVLVRAMGGNYREVIKQYFLFTLLGFVTDGHTITFFALGDGTIVINGVVTNLGPFPNNEPPYIGYSLMGEDATVDPDLLRLHPVFAPFDVTDVDSFMLATDGIDYLVASEGRKKPGLSGIVGPIEQFWQDDKYYALHIAIERELKLIGRDYPQKDPEFGYLRDDTTMIVGRRVPQPAETE